MDMRAPLPIRGLDCAVAWLMTFLPIPPTVLRVIRVARVLRILRLLKNLKGLRDLLMTVVFALPALANVATLLGLVIFMYAVLGMNMFSFVMHGDALSTDRSFETFASACLTLFQCLTGDGWSEVMADCMVNEERGCDPEASPSDCGTPLALPYFISFMVVGSFVFLNIVIAVILDNFTALGNENPDLVSAADIADFTEAWQRYDPDANGKIPTRDLPTLLTTLRAPLGLAESELLKGAFPRKSVLQFCISLQLKQEDGQVAFRNVLDGLIRKNYASKARLFGAAEAPGAGGMPDPSLSPDPDGRGGRGKGGGRKGSGAGGGGGSANGAPLTPRRREMASAFSKDVISQQIHRMREQSPDGSLRFGRSSAGGASPERSPSRSPSRSPGRSPSRGRKASPNGREGRDRKKPKPGAADVFTEALSRATPPVSSGGGLAAADGEWARTPSPWFGSAPASPTTPSPVPAVSAAREMRLNQSRCLTLLLLLGWTGLAYAAGWLLRTSYEMSSSEPSEARAKFFFWEGVLGWWAGGICVAASSCGTRPEMWFGELFPFSRDCSLSGLAWCCCTYVVQWRRTWWCCGDAPTPHEVAVVDHHQTRRAGAATRSGGGKPTSRSPGDADRFRAKAASLYSRTVSPGSSSDRQGPPPSRPRGSSASSSKRARPTRSTLASAANLASPRRLLNAASPRQLFGAARGATKRHSKS